MPIFPCMSLPVGMRPEKNKNKFAAYTNQSNFWLHSYLQSFESQADLPLFCLRFRGGEVWVTGRGAHTWDAIRLGGTWDRGVVLTRLSHDRLRCNPHRVKHVAPKKVQELLLGDMLHMMRVAMLYSAWQSRQNGTVILAAIRVGGVSGVRSVVCRSHLAALGLRAESRRICLRFRTQRCECSLSLPLNWYSHINEKCYPIGCVGPHWLFIYEPQRTGPVPTRCVGKHRSKARQR